MTAPSATPPIDCQQVIRQIWDWLDDELDSVRWNAIREHLAICTGCTEHVTFARSFLEHVQQAPADTDGIAALRARVQAALKAETR